MSYLGQIFRLDEMDSGVEIGRYCIKRAVGGVKWVNGGKTGQFREMSRRGQMRN